jgi:hypothetical protein
MGYDKTAASGQGDESIWDTIRRLCDSIKQIQDQADSGARAIPGLVESSEDAADKLEILSQNFHGLRKYAQEGINTITRQIRRVETSTQMGTSGSVSNPNYKKLVDRLDELEAQPRVYENLEVFTWRRGPRRDRWIESKTLTDGKFVTPFNRGPTQGSDNLGKPCRYLGRGPHPRIDGQNICGGVRQTAGPGKEN